MDAMATILTVLSAIVAVIWAGRHFAVSQGRKQQHPLNGADPGPPEPAPMVSVLIAAKDEQDNIEPCVRSMLAQDYGNFEVIVIDDRSSDDTAAIVRRIAEEDSRLKLLQITELPAGWYGKNHALWRALEIARGQWLCMIDADCVHDSNRSLSVAVQHAADHGADLLSVLPKLEMRGFWENVIEPVCGSIMIYWFHPDKVNAPQRPQAYANGAFMLFRRSAYEAIGGHKAVAGQMMEDLRLAETVKRSGHRLRVVRNAGLYQSRMYTSLSGIIDGWSRIFWGTFTSKRRLRLNMILMILTGLIPYIALIAGLAMWNATGAVPWRTAAWVGAVAAASQVFLIWRLYRLIEARPGLCWTWPLGTVAVIIALYKAYRLHRPDAKLTWRDTTYMANGGD